MQTVDFPSEEIIDEFMQTPIDMSPLQLDWGQPNVVKFVVSIFCFVCPFCIVFQIDCQNSFAVLLSVFLENDGQADSVG